MVARLPAPGDRRKVRTVDPEGRTVMRFLAVALAVGAFAAFAAAADGREPTLLGRAILPADAYQPGPPSGAFISPDNGVTPPFPGQPIPGFSAILDAGHGTFWGMPDNGYGSKTNSSEFPLPLFRTRPDFSPPQRDAAGRLPEGPIPLPGVPPPKNPSRPIPDA